MKYPNKKKRLQPLVEAVSASLCDCRPERQVRAEPGRHKWKQLDSNQ